MNNKLSSELLREAAQGNFKWVNSVIISNMLELDNNTAAKIIIQCCRIFGNSDTSTVEGRDLYQLLITCQRSIKQLNNGLFVGYLQSLYFIVKFFLMQKEFELVLGMKTLLLPNFRDCLKDAKLAKLYTSLCALVYNAVVDLHHDETSYKNSQVFFQLCILSLEMKSIHSSTNILWANTACSYFKLPIFVEADIDLQYNCYLTVLQLFKTSAATKTNRNLSDVNSAIIKILHFVFINLFKQEEFSKIRDYISTTKLAAEKLLNTKMYLKQFNILCNFSKVVVKLEDNQDSSGLLRDNFAMCLEDLKCFSNNYSLPQEFAKLLNLMFSKLLEYYAQVDPTVWNTCMVEPTQMVICKLLGSIGHSISQIKEECRCCSNCRVKDNLYSAVTVTTLAGNFLLLSLRKQESISTSMCSLVFRCLESSCTIIKRLHSQECSQWKSAWTHAGVVIYNIAVKLYALKHDDCCNYFLLLTKNLICLEGVAKSSVFKFDALDTSLQCLSTMSLQSYQFEKALMYSAVGILLSPDPTKAFGMWVTAKAKSKDCDIEKEGCLQQLTVVCVLQQNKNEIKRLYPEVNLDLGDADITNLLVSELAHYKRMWQSKIPMMAAFRKLCDVAELLTVVKVVIETWEDNLDGAHNDVITRLSEIAAKFELETENNAENRDSNQRLEEQFYLVALYAMQYHAQIKIVRRKIVDEINNTVIPEQPPVPLHEAPKNPNDESDLVSSYTSLKLDEHLKIIQPLSKALTVINTCIADCTAPIVAERLRQQNIFNVTVKIAHEFRLHRHSLQAIQAWFSCLKISRLLNNDLDTLQSIAFLLEETNMDSEVIDELLTEAERLKTDLTKLDSPEMWAVVTTYHINKSIMLLRHQNARAGFKEYEQASDCLLKAGENELLKIRLDFLHTRYLRLSCDLQIEAHDVSSLAKCSEVVSSITSYIKVTDTNSSFAIAIFFEVYQAIGHMYHWMYLPREVRCYCKGVVTFAQQLVLPFRTAYLLIYLAHADLLSTRVDDCQVKLNGLSDLLCLDNKRNPSYGETSKNIAIASKDIDVPNLVEHFAEIMLDCPSTDRKYDGSSGSPVMFVKPFTLPSFTKHSFDCDCFYCVSVEYKTLALEYINLEAQLHVVRKNTVAAQACFNGGLQLYRSISKDDSFKTKITKNISCYPLCDWKNILWQTICALMLNYSNSLLRTNNIKKAELFNNKILGLVSKRKCENFYIYNEALFQKHNIVRSMCEKNNRGVQNHLQVNTEVLNPKDINGSPKTPENKQTKIEITCHSPRENSPPKRHWRRIKCHFSDTTENGGNLKVNKPSFPADGIKLNLSDEVNTEDSKGPIKTTCETPAPALAATHNPSTIKTRKKAKPISQDICTPLPKNMDANSCAEQNLSNVIPSSPNAYTPNVLQASSALQSRTKLLTKRIKNSGIKKDLMKELAPEEDNAPSNGRVGNKLGRNNVCKNLMSDLSAAETSKSTKPLYKKKTVSNIAGVGAVKERTDRINARRTTRASSRAVHK